jgi:hypothetical protein
MSNPSQNPNHIPQEFFNNVSPEMLNFTLNTGQNIFNQQRAKWMPGVSGFWLSLKTYFAVSNSYVVQKLSILSYPFSNKNWYRVPGKFLLS